jgi:streptogramin lyase
MIVKNFFLRLAVPLLAALAGLCGCGVQIVPAPETETLRLSGRIVGGQQPIGNAAIYLYQAGTTGNGTGATNLLGTQAYTAVDGSFNITGDYTCPSSATQVYLLASGGNPGISASTNNTASLLMAALGDCGNLTSTTFVYVDEVTTAAAAWALAQFLGPGGIVGASPTNTTGLRNAFLVANNLANTANGTAPGAGLPAGATIEAAKLYSLANALAACVNSAGGASCTPLFSAAAAGGVTPANTLDAAVSIVRHPASQVAAVFNATTPNAPFQPALTRSPNDWTMSIKYTGGGIALPTVLAFDSTGSVWIANYFGGVATKLSAAGVPASATGFGDPALYESYGIAVDTHDNAWITNEEGDSANSYDGSITKFSSTGQLLSGLGIAGGGIYYPYAVAADSNGDMWVADYGDSHASLLDNSGNSLIGSAGYTSSVLPLPMSVAVDGSHNAWFASEGAATLVTPGGTITGFNCCSGPTGIALDPAGAVWISDYSATSLIQLSPSGTVWQRLTGVGGVYYPQSVAIDGAGAAWIANYHGNSISGFTSATGGAASSAISPSTGFGIDANLVTPFGLALDASGNVWVANFNGNFVAQFVGLATPVKTPLLGLPAAP